MAPSGVLPEQACFAMNPTPKHMTIAIRTYARFLEAIALLALLASGCRFNDDPRPVFIDLEDSFQLDLFEKLDFSTRQVQLLLTTLKPLPCQNYSLDYDLFHSGTNIQLQLNSLNPPTDECITPPLPLTTAISLGYLIPNDYKLEIVINDVLAYTGTLEVTPEWYSLHLPSGQGIELLHDTLYRIPANAIWGYAGYDDPQLDQLAADFLDALEALSEPMPLYEGHYGYFTIDASGQPTFHPPAEELYVRPFFRLYTGEREALIQLLEQYRAQSGNQLTIQLYTHRGEQL